MKQGLIRVGLAAALWCTACSAGGSDASSSRTAASASTGTSGAAASSSTGGSGSTTGTTGAGFGSATLAGDAGFSVGTAIYAPDRFDDGGLNPAAVFIDLQEASFSTCADFQAARREAASDGGGLPGRYLLLVVALPPSFDGGEFPVAPNLNGSAPFVFVSGGSDDGADWSAGAGALELGAPTGDHLVGSFTASEYSDGGGGQIVGTFDAPWCE